jgi:ribosomal protein S18 acetylase RimI-like enzyme
MSGRAGAGTRRVGPDDWRTWRRLRLAALADAPSAFGSTLAGWRDAGEDRWRSRLAVDGALDLVAASGGDDVGMASGVLDPTTRSVELISMWVRRDARRTGVARLLIETVERWASERADVLRLSVMPQNDAAIALYTSAGFVLTDERGDLLPDGVRRELIMAKELVARP